MSPAEREAFRQEVIASRRAQGLPDHVEDPTVLALAVEVLADPKRRAARAAQKPVLEGRRVS